MSSTNSTLMDQLRDIESRSALLTEELRESRQKFDQLMAVAELDKEKRMRSLRADAERWLELTAAADP